MKKILVLTTSLILALLLSACASTNCNKQCCPFAPKAECSTKPCKKLTKDMFYKDGKFNQDAAKQAYFDMMKSFGYPISENMKANMWATDFGLGDFPAVGMGGIFWAHENKYGVFGHEILLLPNQFLVEHAHFPFGNLPAKYECWQAKCGKSYCLGEKGEALANFPEVKLPESQKPYITQTNVSVACAKKGNVVWLNRVEAFHSQIAGPEGAIVTEYGSFHQNEGNKFTNPNVKF